MLKRFLVLHSFQKALNVFIAFKGERAFVTLEFTGKKRIEKEARPDLVTEGRTSFITMKTRRCAQHLRATNYQMYGKGSVEKEYILVSFTKYKSIIWFPCYWIKMMMSALGKFWFILIKSQLINI